MDAEWAAALEHFPARRRLPASPRRVRRAHQSGKNAVRMPVFGSLNGTSDEAWLTFARTIEQAGADATRIEPV